MQRIERGSLRRRWLLNFGRIKLRIFEGFFLIDTFKTVNEAHTAAGESYKLFIAA